MQATRSKSLIIGASISALINMAATGAAGAQQSSDSSTPPKPHKAKQHKQAKAKSVVVAQDTKSEMASQIDALREQMNALQHRLDAQTASEQQTKATADKAAAQATAATASVSAATQSIPVEVKTQIEAAKPKTDKIYYKGVTLTLGGYGALETIYRSKSETADMASTFSGVPFNNSSTGKASEFRFSARQSRITALVEGDPTSDVHLSFYGELDFLGAAQTANSNETNSYTPRIRVMYNQIDWADEGLHFLAGQNWSLTTLQGKGMTPRAEIIPPTIDAQYIPGFTFTRQPGVRITKDFDKTYWLALALENPQTTFYNGVTAPAAIAAGKLVDSSAAGSGFNSANTLSLNHIPDVILKAAYESTIAERTVHAEVFGLYRSFFERINYKNEDSSGGGVGAGLNVQVLPGLLDFQITGLGGKGIGRYGAGQLTDVTLNSDGYIKPVSEIQALAGLTLHASPALDLYLFAGEEKATAQAYYATSATGATVGYGYGNPLYVNSGCNYEGAPGACTGNTRVVEQGTAGFWYKPWNNKSGRYQVGLQYSYTERKSFAGAGGIAPVAIDNMVFASFRYYPF
jgi:hypothetical protein